jgi:biopolymer transport protein ExbB
MKSRPDSEISIRSRLLFLVFLFAMVPLAALASPATEVSTGGGLNLWAMLRQGGWAMYPLGLCSVAMFFLIFYGYRETHRKKFVPDLALPQLADHMSARDLRRAGDLLNATPTVLSRSLQAGLQRARPDLEDANKDKIEGALVESLEHEENSVGQWINYLNVVATVAPMIGLLGTVSGMIGAFQTIKEGGMGRPELLAGDIGEALITTATGLVIGIPAMIAYFILRNRLDNAMLAVTQTASHLVDRLAGEIGEPVYDPPAAEATVEPEAIPEPGG